MQRAQHQHHREGGGSQVAPLSNHIPSVYLNTTPPLPNSKLGNALQSPPPPVQHPSRQAALPLQQEPLLLQAKQAYAGKLISIVPIIAAKYMVSRTPMHVGSSCAVHDLSPQSQSAALCMQCMHYAKGYSDFHNRQASARSCLRQLSSILLVAEGVTAATDSHAQSSSWNMSLLPEWADSYESCVMMDPESGLFWKDKSSLACTFIIQSENLVVKTVITDTVATGLGSMYLFWGLRRMYLVLQAPDSLISPHKTPNDFSQKPHPQD